MNFRLALSLFVITYTAFTFAAGQAKVYWTDPGSYHDIRSTSGAQEEFAAGVIKELELHIHKLATEYLGEGQSLEMSVTDLDLAGDVRISGAKQGHSEVRVIKEIYPAKMKFQYQLSDASGKVIKEGSEELRSRYPSAASMRSSNNERLAMEKKMLERWFKRTFK